MNNQRAYPRYAVNVDVAVTLSGSQTVFCAIHDFCVGGLFLACSSIADNLTQTCKHGSPLTVEFDTPNGPFQLQGNAVRVGEDGVGVQFTHRNIAALKYLQDLSSRQGEASGEHGGVMLRQPNPAVAEAGARIIYTFVAWLIEEYLKRLSDDLFEASSNAQNNEEQSTFFYAFKELKRQEGDLHDHFIELMERQLELFTIDEFKNAYKVHEAGGGQDGLTLVDKDEFDKWLSVTGLINSIESRYEQELYEVEKRLDSISKNPVNRENDPAGPFALCHIFFDALEGAFEDIRVSQMVFEAFQKIFRIHYPEMLSQLNSLFADEAILQDLEQEYEIVKLGADGEPVDEEPDEEEAEAPANAAAATGAQRTGSAPSYGGAQRAAGGQRAAQPSMSEQPT
ncbi:MAG: DUF1631 family protein, partial [Gammaproteobacteria bacterium]|nr:DUF1631 family protein [Gammaproteobacteria bacterium]